MIREEFDNRINEAVLAVDDLADKCRARGMSEASIALVTESANEKIQKQMCRFMKEEADMKINEAILNLDEMEDNLRYAGVDEATINSLREPIYEQIQENAARAAIRFAPISENFSDSVFSGVDSAGVDNVSAANLDGFPRLGNPDSLTYDQTIPGMGGSIMGVKEAGLASIIDESKLAEYVTSKLTGRYNAPEPKPTLEAQMDHLINQMLNY